MRTAIFVYEPSKLSINTAEDGLSLEHLKGDPVELARANSLPLAPGVYRVISQQPIKVSVDVKVKAEVDIVTGDLDGEVPEPRPKMLPDPDPNSMKSQEFKAACKAFLAKEPKNDEKLAKEPENEQKPGPLLVE